jgi:Flp pilus assembly protein TadB
MVPGFLDVLFRTIPGILVLTIFILLQVGGFLLIQRISRIKV